MENSNSKKPKTGRRKPLLTDRVVDGLADLLEAVPVSFTDSPEHKAAIAYIAKLVTYCRSEAYQKKRSDLNAKIRDWHLKTSGRVIVPGAQGRRKKPKE